MVGEVRVQPASEAGRQNRKDPKDEVVDFDYVIYEGRAWECHDLGRSFQTYWIDPSGKLWWIDCEGTHDFLILQPGDEGYDARHTWKNTEIIKNGHRGRVSPCCFTGYLDLLPKLIRHRPNTLRLKMVEGVRVKSIE